jgi:hypothetical protein
MAYRGWIRALNRAKAIVSPLLDDQQAGDVTPISLEDESVPPAVRRQILAATYRGDRNGVIRSGRYRYEWQHS